MSEGRVQFRVDDVVEAIDLVQVEGVVIEIGARMTVRAVSGSGNFIQPQGVGKFVRAGAFTLIQRRPASRVLH